MEQYLVTGRLADGNSTPFRAKVEAKSEAEAIYKAEHDENDTIYYLKGLKAVNQDDEIADLKAKYQMGFFINLVAICVIIAFVGTYIIGLF